MDLEKFVANVAEQFEEPEASAIRADTVFKDMDEYNSMVALSLIAMIDAEYDVAVSGNDIEMARTIKDLFDRIATLKG